MKLDNFRVKEENVKVKLINNRLKELKSERLTTKAFRSNELEFSYTSAYKEMKSLGYVRHGDAFIKTKDSSSLNEPEILALKRIIADYTSKKSAQTLKPKVVRRTDNTMTSTSIRVNKLVWQRFQEFTKYWSIYRSSDLLSLALENFLDQHEFDNHNSFVKEDVEEKE